MEYIDLNNLTVCQQCGCVFDIFESANNYSRNGDILKYTICPACKHEYEMPTKNNFKN